MSKKIRITYDRQNCIGAGSCCIVCPKFWKMADDGKADFIGAKKNLKTDKYELELNAGEKTLKCLKESASSCPVQVIKIT